MMARFCRYVDKVFDLTGKLSWLTDGRVEPRIPTQSIWLSALLMRCAGLPSLNALESQTALPRRWEKVIGRVMPSVDRVGDVTALMAPQPIRRILREVLYRLKRNKALPSPWPLSVAVLDGHEFFSLQEPAL